MVLRKKNVRELNLTVKYVTFNHSNVSSNLTALKGIFSRKVIFLLGIFKKKKTINIIHMIIIMLLNKRYCSLHKEKKYF